MAATNISTGIDAVILTIASTSSAITRFIRVVRDARADLAGVTGGLSELRLWLDLLADDKDQIPSSLDAPALEMLASCAGLLERIASVLTKYKDGTQWAERGRSQMLPLRTTLDAYRGCVELTSDLTRLTTTSPGSGTQRGRDQFLADILNIQSQLTLKTEQDLALHSYLTALARHAEKPKGIAVRTPERQTSPRGCERAASHDRSKPSSSPPETSSNSPRQLSAQQLSRKPVVTKWKPIPSPPRRDERSPPPIQPHFTAVENRPVDANGAIFQTGREAGRPSEPLGVDYTSPEGLRHSPIRNNTDPVLSTSPSRSMRTEYEQSVVAELPTPEAGMYTGALGGSGGSDASHKPSPYDTVGPWYPREDLSVPFYQNNNNPALLGNLSRGSSYDASTQRDRGPTRSSPVPPPVAQLYSQEAHTPAATWNISPSTHSSQGSSVAQPIYHRPAYAVPAVAEDRVSPPPVQQGRPQLGGHSGSFRYNNGLSDAASSVPATPRSARSATASSLTDQSVGPASPVSDTQPLVSAPMPRARMSPVLSHTSSPKQYEKSVREPTNGAGNRSSLDSFQLAPDPLGVYHVSSSMPSSSPRLKPPTHVSLVSAISTTAPAKPISLPSPVSPPPYPGPTSPNSFPLNNRLSSGSHRLSTGSSRLSSNSSKYPQFRAAKDQLDMIPTTYFLEKDKGHSVYYLDVSPSASVVASKYGNNIVKLWSLALGSLQTSIKFTSYVNAQLRSREYFVRSHAILSEAATLIAITVTFGNSIEIWNWTKRKKVQVINDAHRWASLRNDVYHSPWAPVAVYRGLAMERIDLFRVAPDAKAGMLAKAKAFIETQPIDLRRSGLPFVPRFPELAFSSTSPLLVVAAGPKPGDPPRAQTVLLAAWQLGVLQGESHQLYRCHVPDHPEIQDALPISLSIHGATCVSIWIPAHHKDVGSDPRHRHATAEVTVRYVLVWDLIANTTRLFGIPNVLACISPDCRFVAYCDAKSAVLAVLDVATVEEVSRWPDFPNVPGYGQLDDLAKVTELSFSGNGSTLVIGDAKGGVGCYELRATTTAPVVAHWSELQ